ncbi:hypothetical protein PENSPDRAFT_23681 [Peniophora sp. CONT]|nr:hypothetical protein PENSPDRAFT_23681 [Peniophora sp. CONT]
MWRAYMIGELPVVVHSKGELIVHVAHCRGPESLSGRKHVYSSDHNTPEQYPKHHSTAALSSLLLEPQQCRQVQHILLSLAELLLQQHHAYCILPIKELSTQVHIYFSGSHFFVG